ncbi:hypothetical protein N7510_004913 [Penicillium lagena]|uniref:uncharacterized protein n=1 Tax=Penicillium lagena TaxID=94218 RepID=UPI00254218DC|nr:uncharacterized protein N7510_004913 [Penicillium lagena]KAJ5620929.1 hypothetical protein N7510_004913 [Penicillium lagena]
MISPLCSAKRFIGHNPDEGLVHLIGFWIKSAFRLVGLDPNKRKPNASPKKDQTRSDTSAAKTASCLPKPNHDDPDLTNLLKFLDRKRRLEVEIEILEEMSRGSEARIAFLSSEYSNRGYGSALEGSYSARLLAAI